jgi:hypothetical protein
MRKINVFGVLLTSFLTGCGGGEAGVDAPVAQGVTASTIAQLHNPTASPQTCGTDLLPMPSAPAGARRVTEYGAAPDDDQDDTSAIQRALSAMREGEWLVFPPGRYVHNKSLTIDVKGAKLWGDGATLHGTNPADQAVWIRADDVEVYRFTKTALTDRRRSAPWDAGISIYSINGVKPVYRTIIRGNRLIASDRVGTAGQASASSAGILAYRARDFLIAENFIERTLADGIHMTGASRNGRVVGNVVRETGDDMVAVVSYIGDNWTSSAQSSAGWLDRRREAEEVRDVLIANNDVSGQYWGRGIAVVGGSNVTIRRNRIARSTAAAAIYLSREMSYRTFGSRNILVTGNTIDDSRVSRPLFVPAGPAYMGLQSLLSQPTTTGHAAIEVYATADAAELRAAAGSSHLAIQRIRLEGNTIHKTASSGVRIGNYSPTGSISGISLVANRMTDIRHERPIDIVVAGLADSLFCSANTREGAPVSARACAAAAAVPVTGASVSCQ